MKKNLFLFCIKWIIVLLLILYAVFAIILITPLHVGVAIAFVAAMLAILVADKEVDKKNKEY